MHELEPGRRDEADDEPTGVLDPEPFAVPDPEPEPEAGPPVATAAGPSAEQAAEQPAEQAAEPDLQPAAEPAAPSEPQAGPVADTPPDAPAPPSLGVFVVSADPELLECVAKVGDGEYPVLAGEEWQAVAAALDESRCGIVLLDLDSVGRGLGAWLGQLERRAEPPVVVAAASVRQAPELMKAMAAGRIHRLLLKPATPGKTRLLLEAAISRRQQPREQPAAPPPATARPAAPARMPRPPGGKRGLLIGGAMLAVFGIFVVAGLMRGKSQDTAPPPEAPVARDARDAAPQLVETPAETPPLVAPAPRPDPFAERLARARQAFDAGRLVEPADDNALNGYAAILAVQPEHVAAKAGLAATIELLFTWAESAMLGDELDLAAMTLDHVRRVRPDSSRLAFLDAQLERARARQAEQAAAQAEATEAEATPREVQRLLGLANTRLRNGQLLQPAGDNALIHYRQAAALDATDRGVTGLRGRLGEALIAAARQALDGEDAARAETLLTEARHLGADAATLATLEGRLGELREMRRLDREAQLLARGLERLRDEQILEPENDSAAYYLASLRSENAAHPGLAEAWQSLNSTIAARVVAAVAEQDWQAAEAWLAGLEQIGAERALVGVLAGDLAVARRQAVFLGEPVSADELQLLSSRPPVYPESALRNNTQGWVELDFVVDRDGRPRDMTVAEAQPPGVFDRAAMNAVARYRYEPFVEDGVTYERRARLRIRFTLQ
jgi:periplasmic protein TonB